MTLENTASIYARSKALSIVVVLLIVIMSFSGFMNYMTFADNYNNSLANTYAVAGQEFVRNIEYAVQYGKPIDNYYGMNDILRELQETVPEAQGVYVINTEGKYLYSVDGFVSDRHITPSLLQAATYQEHIIGNNISFQSDGGQANLFIGIQDHSSELVASLMMVFVDEAFIRWDSQPTIQLATILAIISILLVIILAVLFFRRGIFDGAYNINKKRLMVTLLVLLGFAQISYSIANYKIFKDAYMEMAETSGHFVEKIVTNNLQSIYDKGITLENITGFEEYLDSIPVSLPQIKAVTETNGIIAVEISNKFIQRQMNQIMLDMATVTVISIFFMVEMTLLVILLLTANNHGSNTVTRAHGLSRSLAFFINFSAFMPMTFIAVYMQHVYVPIGNLSKDVVLGLPLSAEMFGGVLAIVMASRLIARVGWRNVFYLGILAIIAGNALSYYSADGYVFVMARGIAGLGIGYIMMTMRSLVVSMPENNAGIAAFSAGGIAGLNCGAVMGGMLVDRIGYEFVFLIAALMAILPFYFVRKFMTGYEIVKRETGSHSINQLLRKFIINRKTVLFLGCLFIPYFIGGAFLDYFFPLLASSNGLTQSDISRGVLINGLMIIYAGPLLTNYINKRFGEKNGILLSVATVMLALAVYSVWGTVAAAFVTVMLLGVAESFGVSMKTTHFLQLEGIRDMEVSQGVAGFSIMVNLSRMAGPIVFGVVLSLGARTGIGIIVIAMVTLLAIFLITERKTTIGGNHGTTSAQ